MSPRDPDNPHPHPHSRPRTPRTPRSMTPHGGASPLDLSRARSATSVRSMQSSIGLAAEPDPPRPGDPELPLSGAPLDVGPPPDGGRDAWLCVTGTFLQLFCVFGLLTSAGQLQSYYIDHQLKGYTKAQIAWISSIQPLMVFGWAIWTGRYFDVHGARLLAWSGTFMATLAVMGMALSSKYWQFLLSHMCFGIAGTLIYSPATAVAGHWFLKKRSTAVGIIVAGSGLGGVIYPIMIKELLEMQSFRNTMLIIMCFNVALMVPACFWVKARLPPRHPPPLKAFKGPWKEPRYLFLCIGVASYGFNILTPYFNASNLAVSNNQSQTIVDYSVAILQAGSFVGRVLAGVLADRFGVWNVFGTIPFLTSITMFAFWVASPIGLAPTLLGQILYGIWSGGWFTLAAAATAAISPTSEIGMRIGMMWNTMAIPALIGPVISGQLITVAGDKFKYAGIFTGCTFLISGFFTVGPPLWVFVRRVFGCPAQTDDAVSIEQAITPATMQSDGKTVVEEMTEDIEKEGRRVDIN